MSQNLRFGTYPVGDQGKIRQARSAIVSLESSLFIHNTCADPEGGGTGGPDPPPPLKNHKNIGSLSNTGPDPLKITNLPSQHSMLGHHRHASKTPLKWRFVGRWLMA